MTARGGPSRLTGRSLGRLFSARKRGSISMPSTGRGGAEEEVGSSHYIADSIFARLGKPSVVAVVAPLVAAGRVAICRPCGLRARVLARNQHDYRALMDGLLAFSSVPATDADHRRALEVQAALVIGSRHRQPSRAALRRHSPCGDHPPGLRRHRAGLHPDGLPAPRCLSDRPLPRGRCRRCRRPRWWMGAPPSSMVRGGHCRGAQPVRAPLRRCFELVAGVTGQDQQWVVERGSAD